MINNKKAILNVRFEMSYDFISDRKGTICSDRLLDIEHQAFGKSIRFEIVPKISKNYRMIRYGFGIEISLKYMG